MSATEFQKVFITGANGFIGRKLAEKFRQQGAQVCGMDMVENLEQNIVKGTLSHPDTWRDMLQGCDLVIHTAAVVSNALSYEQTWQVNVEGTKTVLDEAIACRSVKRFVHISSVAACGFESTTTIDESMPLKTQGHPYRDSKILSEHLVMNYHSQGKIDCTIVRPADVYGPGSRPWVITPIEEMKKNKFIVPKGMFGPVYIDDLVEGIYLAAYKDAGKGQIFIISGDQEVTNTQYFGYLANMLGKHKVPTLPNRLLNSVAFLNESLFHLFGKTTEINPNTMKMLSRPCADYSHAKAQALLGYQPKVSLSDGMENSRQWLQDNGYLQS
ncbi:NAD-dependent epimerase/dehydratase family protein [Thalassotalea sp. PLHSN55]|uniref:NAD-dependent epimerase/dehydratase family protein n=1 Tax=Thalassotalea sp. PLHSN55 TaxID=3435888 RepID=UPI003F83B156